jgi:pimeloyl-ACP methyl ester carboxylesterase
VQTGYAQIGPLSMYHEIEGDGPPLLLLHGAYMSADTMAGLRAGLTGSWRVITPELQGHGRTADADRPLTYEQMADDMAALLRQVGAAPADVVGFSLGGRTALQLAIRHPDLVKRLVVISASYRHDGTKPEALALYPTITPEMFAGSPAEQAYRELAPDPDDFPALVRKIVALLSAPHDWSADAIRAIAAPTLIVVGDADLIRLEHAAELFHLRGGGAIGDFAELPDSRLAVLPGTSHFIPPGSGVLDRTHLLLEMIVPFLREAAGGGR